MHNASRFVDFVFCFPFFGFSLSVVVPDIVQGSLFAISCLVAVLELVNLRLVSKSGSSVSYIVIACSYLVCGMSLTSALRFFLEIPFDMDPSPSNHVFEYAGRSILHIGFGLFPALGLLFFVWSGIDAAIASVMNTAQSDRLRFVAAVVLLSIFVPIFLTIVVVGGILAYALDDLMFESIGKVFLILFCFFFCPILSVSFLDFFFSRFLLWLVLLLPVWLFCFSFSVSDLPGFISLCFS